ncbi:cytochrome c biogenesis protein ResB [Desulfogranum japonicum]|uniref:cytochrome c biogenesis protein ResB n=1 Tax=Desulfogranum japonicum TaxID=231447 RepID=UPI00048DB89D|nr:cytochrome c biogenesis protein ResB [Desulfogranum japonicum]
MSNARSNPIVAFFASVQLALFLLFILAATSIIGTIIPQNQPSHFYIEKYGEQAARFMGILDFTDMYSSWWFLALLLLFVINLIVCSLKRIPQVLKLIRKDNLKIQPDRLQNMHFSHSVSYDEQTTPQQIDSFLRNNGWKPEQRVFKNGILFFSEKGAWTRFGVYVVHLSILIILTGAVLGSSMFANKVLHRPDFAFKGSMAIPETQKNNRVFPFGKQTPIPLGFTVRCNSFSIDYYANGMPKTYLSQVTIFENGKPVPTMEDIAIKVNKPLKYKGVTLYQSSYQPFQDFLVTVKKQGDNDQPTLQKQAVIAPAKQQKWQEADVSFGILNREISRNITQRIKVWFSDNQGKPSIFWVAAGQEASIERPTGTYTFTAKQLYATVFQVTKDPGVWLVYLGCGLMLLGLYIAFFTSHKKIFAYLNMEDQGCTLLLAGNTNKNKVGFEKTFQALVDASDELHH